MVIGVILTILGGVVLHQKKDEILPGIRKNIEKLYQNPNANLEAITLLQESLECCGGNDFRDFDKQVGYCSNLFPQEKRQKGIFIFILHEKIGCELPRILLQR